MKKFLFFLIFLGFCLVLKSEEKKEVINPFKELVNWTFEQNVGITCFYDIDEKDYLIGAKWQFLKSKHNWLFTGLFATEKPSLGIHFGFNLGKLIEKIKGEPLIYLKHLEVGYAITWELNSEGRRKDGVYLNVIKIEF